MIKLTGIILVVICGTAAGAYAADRYKKRFESLLLAQAVIEQLLIMLEYESPTVGEMIAGLKRSNIQLPVFIKELPENADAKDAVKSILKNKDGYEKCDLDKISELFNNLGSADKCCELQRLKSAGAYFEGRAERSRPDTERKIKLSRYLGLLGGIFLAVLLV
ncbi:MAG: stage III sporulation protein AB [Oscillospiraceae bacterium]